jgi:hypothetical protein
MSTHDTAPAATRNRSPKTWRNLAVGVPMLVMLMAAEGDCALDWLKLQSPVQAVTRVLVQPDGSVLAELTLVTTEDYREHRFADGATNVELRVPGGAIVELEPVGEGRYVADSKTSPELLWMPGERYRVTFELDDTEEAGDYAGEAFIAVVDAPADEINFAVEHVPEFVGDTAELSWRPTELDAVIEVYDPNGELIFSTFDMSTPEFDGDKWASIARFGAHTIPVDVFTEAGSYTISACVLASREGLDAELSSALGPGSGFLAGECFEPIEFTVSP